MGLVLGWALRVVSFIIPFRFPYSATKIQNRQLRNKSFPCYGVPETNNMDLPERSPEWHPSTKIFFAALLVGSALVVAWMARSIMPIFALAAVLAFLVTPIIKFLNKKLKFPRLVALLVAYLLIFVSLGLLSIGLAVGVTQSLDGIDAETTVGNLRENAVGLLETFEEVNLFGYTFDATEFVTPIKDAISDTENVTRDKKGQEISIDQRVSVQVTENVEDERSIRVSKEQAQIILGSAARPLQTAGEIVLALIFSTLIVIMIAVYLNLDSAKLHKGFVSYIPEKYVGEIEHLGEKIRKIWKYYFYGQLINSLATGLLLWLALFIAGLPGAFLMAIIMVFLNMIPTFGPIIATVPGVVAAFAFGSKHFEIQTWLFALIVLGIYIVVVQGQAMLMAPLITGKAVKMSPASIIVGIIIGLGVAGIIGALLAVPIMASGKEIIKYLLAKLTDKRPFSQV